MTADASNPAAPGSQRGRTARLLRSVAGVAISGGLLWWVVRKADLTSVMELVSNAHLGWLALAYALFLTAAIVHAGRFSVLLSATGSTLRFPKLVRAQLIGLTWNTVLPGELGLDAVRVHMAGRDVGGRSRALAAVLVDRFNGAIAMAGLSCLACGLLRMNYDVPVGLFVPPLAVMVAGLFAALLGHLALKPTAARFLSRLNVPAFLRRNCETLAAALGSMLRRWPHLIGATGLAGCQCLILAVALAMLSRGLSLPATGLAVAASFPIIAIVTMTVPLTLNGLGIREAMFSLTGTAIGLDETQAFALASSWLLIMLLGAVPGAISLLGPSTGKSRPLFDRVSPAPRPMSSVRAAPPDHRDSVAGRPGLQAQTVVGHHVNSTNHQHRLGD